jgi:DNA-binding response OmpR family regulator
VEADFSSLRGPVWRGSGVLVVDDEPPIRRIIRRKLEAEQFRVEEAGDGESALRLIQSRAEPFDLVLTDLTMPEIDGLQIAETLKRYRPTVAVLCMSAHPEALPPIELTDASIAVLRKPFSADELYVVVQAEITRAKDLVALAESEIVRANAGLSGLALALKESRTLRLQSVDLVAAARELRRILPVEPKSH